jgi:excisionase family DNA binding protein
MSATQATVLEQEKPLAVSVSRAASLVGVSRWSIRNFAKTGRLRVSRLGRRTVIPFESLEQLIRDSAALEEK